MGDDTYSYFPLVETYTGGSWSASIAPVPSDAAVEGDGISVNEQLISVSCPQDGFCVAVGVYTDVTGHSNGLMDVLSNGTWSASSGPLPGGPDNGNTALYSVSCATATSCMAVGNGNIDTRPMQWYSTVYTYGTNGWTLQAEPTLPADYSNNLDVEAVSCDDATDCIVVGDYGNGTAQVPSLWTYSSGNWSYQQAPLPANAASSQGWSPVGPRAVDCIGPGSCVAAGDYEGTDGNLYPLVLTLNSGAWSPVEAPLPSNAVIGDASNASVSSITGISCPSIGNCVADGIYEVDATTGQTDGMFLTQSASGWTVTPAPMPAFVFHGKLNTNKHRSATKASLSGISCLGASFCRGVGADGSRALIEKMKRR